MPPTDDDDDDFEKWRKQLGEAEADSDRPLTPPEGEEEFTDDDGTKYKWDRGLRAWVPQVGSWRYNMPLLSFVHGFCQVLEV